MVEQPTGSKSSFAILRTKGPLNSHVKFSFGAQTPVVTQLTAGFLTLFLLATCAIGLGWWITHKSSMQIARSAHAHSIVAGYLSLARSTSALFKQFSDTLLNREKITSGDKQHIIRLIAATENDLKHLSALTTPNQGNLGFDEMTRWTQSGARLNKIKQGTREVISEFGLIGDPNTRGRTTAANESLYVLLNVKIDRQFNTLLTSAIEDEALIAVTIDAEADAAINTFRRGLYALFAVSAIVFAMTIFLVRQRLQTPLAKLTSGAAEMASGTLSRRIAPSKSPETNTLAEHYNALVNKLEEKSRNLSILQNTFNEELKKRTEYLAIGKDRVEKRERDRKRFLDEINNDLRATLTGMYSNAESLLHSNTTRREDGEDIVRQLMNDTRDLAFRIEGLMIRAGGETNKFRLSDDAVAVGNLLTIACCDAQERAQKKGLTVVQTIDLHGVVIYGDEHRLRSLFHILLDNAIDYSPPTLNVDVSGTRVADKVIVRIGDQGAGISSDKLAKIFESPRSEKGPGSLVQALRWHGLPLAKAIVDSHGGNIEIDSTPQKGTTVTVALSLERCSERIA